MSDDIPSLAEAMAGIRRLRDEIRDLEGSLLAAEYRHQAEIAMLRGTLAQPQPDEPPTITHDVPPNAPR